MPDQTIQSQNLAITDVFQKFYRVPDYQREYVWGEADPKGQGGDEVEQFLTDIHNEFGAVNANLPDYFIGTIVVCPALDLNAIYDDALYDVIDGQQRLTTIFLTLCAIQDLLNENHLKLPGTLPSLITFFLTNAKGETTQHVRLNLQYADSKGVLESYAMGEWKNAPTDGTRSIKNISGAYRTIREFLDTRFKADLSAIVGFYGYFINKVKLIRIETTSVAKALKIFETINDRGVGLDAMDLLKNLLFMNAGQEDFVKLKAIWKEVTDLIYRAHEKPLRFLRYFLFADYNVTNTHLQEDEIYDWFLKNEEQTGHAGNPIGFVDSLLGAATIYTRFGEGKGPDGTPNEGIINTRLLGGTAVRQHYILLLAGRHLKAESFRRLAREIENLMFVYLITKTSPSVYEGSIIGGARDLRKATNEQFEEFCGRFFVAEKQRFSRDFDNRLRELRNGDIQAFRMRYLLAKLTQEIDVRAFGGAGWQGSLKHYLDGNKNDIEHILPETPSVAALDEFGEKTTEPEIPQRLGNLMFLESSFNKSLGNKPYSEKSKVYCNSNLLLAKCQPFPPKVGSANLIAKAISTVPSFDKWNRKALEDRQTYLAKLSREVWGMPPDT